MKYVAYPKETGVHLTALYMAKTGGGGEESINSNKNFRKLCMLYAPQNMVSFHLKIRVLRK